VGLDDQPSPFNLAVDLCAVPTKGVVPALRSEVERQHRQIQPEDDLGFDHLESVDVNLAAQPLVVQVAWFSLSLTEFERAVREREPIVAEWQRDTVRLMGADLDRLIRDVS
jgi:hypothetical protein